MVLNRLTDLSHLLFHPVVHEEVHEDSLLEQEGEVHQSLAYVSLLEEFLLRTVTSLLVFPVNHTIFPVERE